MVFYKPAHKDMIDKETNKFKYLIIILYEGTPIQIILTNILLK